jgi:hypothetical protein
MPRIDFDALPDEARVWVFAADQAMTSSRLEQVLKEVDSFLAGWAAHGAPLACARDWRDDHFLAIGVDESAAGASGCSIDGLFRVLQRLRDATGVDLLPGGRVYWRDPNGTIRIAARPAFGRLAAEGGIDGATIVFDTTVESVGAWRDRFEGPAAEHWHAELIPATKSA